MAEIFVSYRRTDAPASAAALFEQLKAHFGEKQVFRDIDSIDAGENFEEAIRDAIRAASAVLVVIGPRWLDLRDGTGARRLEQEEDYVRREIELALASDTLVVPVLVEHAALPTAPALPGSVREMTKHNAVALSPERWDADVANLIRQLESKGIPVLAPEAPAASEPLYRVVLRAITGFIPDLFTLLRQPRRFLARATQGRPAELTHAFVFFVLTVALAVALLLSGYTPMDSIVAFALAVLMFGVIAALAVSVPLWLVWRIVGARRHYARLLLVLLYQLAVLHLAALFAAWVILVALDLQSQNVVRDTMHLATQTGASADAGLRIIRERLVPLVETPQVRVALGVAALAMAAALAWTLWSWRAYRDAFGLTRTRSAAALIACVVAIWALAKLVP